MSNYMGNNSSAPMLHIIWYSDELYYNTCTCLYILAPHKPFEVWMRLSGETGEIK